MWGTRELCWLVRYLNLLIVNNSWFWLFRKLQLKDWQPFLNFIQEVLEPLDFESIALFVMISSIHLLAALLIWKLQSKYWQPYQPYQKPNIRGTWTSWFWINSFVCHDFIHSFVGSAAYMETPIKRLATLSKLYTRGTWTNRMQIEWTSLSKIMLYKRQP